MTEIQEFHICPGGLYRYTHVAGIPEAIVWDSTKMYNVVHKLSDGDVVLVLEFCQAFKPRIPLPGSGMHVIIHGIMGWIYVGTTACITKRRYQLL